MFGFSKLRRRIRSLEEHLGVVFQPNEGGDMSFEGHTNEAATHTPLNRLKHLEKRVESLVNENEELKKRVENNEGVRELESDVISLSLDVEALKEWKDEQTRK